MNKKNAEISARIAEMIENLGLKPNSFAKALGYGRAQTIYDIINGKSAPSYDFFYKFATSEYSEIIDIMWLLTGIGQIRKTKRYEWELTNNNNANSNSKVTDNLPQQQEQNGIFVSQLLETIREQAEEIGHLKERIAQLEKENAAMSSGAQDASSIPSAHAG